MPAPRERAPGLLHRRECAARVLERQRLARRVVDNDLAQRPAQLDVLRRQQRVFEPLAQRVPTGGRERVVESRPKEPLRVVDTTQLQRVEELRVHFGIETGTSAEAANGGKPPGADAKKEEGEGDEANGQAAGGAGPPGGPPPAGPPPAPTEWGPIVVILLFVALLVGGLIAFSFHAHEQRQKFLKANPSKDRSKKGKKWHKKQREKGRM